MLGVSSEAVWSIGLGSLKTTALIDGFSALAHQMENPVTGELYVFEGMGLLRLESAGDVARQSENKEAYHLCMAF